MASKTEEHWRGIFRTGGGITKAPNSRFIRWTYLYH